MTSRAEVLEYQGMPAVRWRSRDGASAIATLQGAHLVSWIPSRGEEGLYVSPRSAFEAGRPIRGGIPVVFPQFSERGPLVKHGFARTLAWTLVDESESEQGSRVRFALESSPQTLALWPEVFRLELSVTIGGSRLDVQLRVENMGKDAFAFAAALHTYFRVTELATARLEGLPGGIVRADVPIDRVYLAAPLATRFTDTGRALRIEQRGFKDTVVWNPGREGAEKMTDLPPDGYLHMLCVEAAAIEPSVSLTPGAAWVGVQSIERENAG